MTDGCRNFYLAAGWAMRQQARLLAGRIAAATGARCMSRWLCRNPRLEASAAAEQDIMDIGDADLLIALCGRSTRGGKWIEVGYALGLSLPVVFLVPAGERTPLPVFATLDDVAVIRARADGTWRLRMPDAWPGPRGDVGVIAKAFVSR